MRRANIYTAFIEKSITSGRLPKGTKIKTDSGGYKIVIELP
jgi:hypothetical protein